MLAPTEVGLPAAIAAKLAEADPEGCSAAAEQLKVQAGKALQRQKEQRAHEKNLQKKNKKPWAPPPKAAKQTQSPPAAKKQAKPFAPKGKLTIKKQQP